MLMKMTEKIERVEKTVDIRLGKQVDQYIQVTNTWRTEISLQQRDHRLTFIYVLATCVDFLDEGHTKLSSEIMETRRAMTKLKV